MTQPAPAASIVIPAYNVAATIGDAVESALAQTYADFEVIVVDDGSRDDTVETVLRVAHPRLRLVRQANRGLAGARNSGIAAARGRYVGFLDGDDIWAPEKLAAHVAHLEANPHVGLSFTASQLIDGEGRPLGLNQTPRLTGIDAAHILRRNPIGNGSAPVIRRATLDAIAFRPAGEAARDWWFDETFRQSEDVECWMRIALTTGWTIEGIAGAFTLYRVNPGGLSANLARQHASWERMVAKMARIAPDFIARHAPAARAYQLRYLCRRAVASRDGAEAMARARASIAESREPLLREPVKTLTTLAAAALLSGAGAAAYSRLEGSALGLKRRIA